MPSSQPELHGAAPRKAPRPHKSSDPAVRQEPLPRSPPAEARGRCYCVNASPGCRRRLARPPSASPARRDRGKAGLNVSWLERLPIPREHVPGLPAATALIIKQGPRRVPEHKQRLFLFQSLDSPNLSYIQLDIKPPISFTPLSRENCAPLLEIALRWIKNSL